MKSIQNGQMSPEKVRKIFSDLRSQLDKLEELVMEEALMQEARWDFPSSADRLHRYTHGQVLLYAFLSF